MNPGFTGRIKILFSSKKFIIAASAIIIVITAGIFAVVFFSSGNAVRAMNVTQLNLGEKYLAEQNYARATVTLSNVISVEPNNTEAYIALSKAFLYMGDVNMAQETLETGLKNTGSIVIERELRDIANTGNTPSQIPGEPVEPDTEAVIIEIAGRSYRSDMTDLVLRGSVLTDTDMQKLSGFTNLERLDISGSGINDISAVANLTTLKKFFAANNQISDITPLGNLQSLEYAGLRGNHITDASALFAIDSLLYLHLSGNRLDSVSQVGGNMLLLYVADNNIEDFSAVKNAGLLYYDISGNPGR